MRNLVVAISLPAVAWFWHRAEGRTALIMLAEPPGEGGYASISPVQHDKILGIRQDLSVDTDALTALNVNAFQAESLLSSAHSWVLSNESSVDTLRSAIDQKGTAIRRLEQAIAAGPTTRSVGRR